jgi:hypothetical protein
MLRRAAYVAGIAATASACSLIFGLDGYEGRDASAGGQEGGTDASSEATGADATDADAADSGCPGHPTAILCDNFDDGPLGAKWDATLAPLHANLALSDAESVSSPFSLLASVAFSDASDAPSAAAELSAYVPYVPSKMRISYNVMLGEPPPAGHSVAIGAVYFNGPLQASYGIYLFVKTDVPDLTMYIAEDAVEGDGGTYFLTHTFQSFGTNKWTHVILDLDLGPAPSVTLTLEQPPSAPPDASTPVIMGSPLTPIPGATSMNMNAGIDFVLLPAGWTVYVDDVVFETE